MAKHAKVFEDKAKKGRGRFPIKDVEITTAEDEELPDEQAQKKHE